MSWLRFAGSRRKEEGTRQRREPACGARIKRFVLDSALSLVPDSQVAIMATTMQAVVKAAAAAGAEIREVKIPAFGRSDVLVKVKVA